MFSTTDVSGAVEAGVPQVGGRGTTIGQALEGSNVDLPEQFTEMIVIQRGYQANSQVLSAASDLLKNTIQMIR
jgi:flagellar hook protein FlgE